MQPPCEIRLPPHFGHMPTPVAIALRILGGGSSVKFSQALHRRTTVSVSVAMAVAEGREAADQVDRHLVRVDLGAFFSGVLDERFRYRDDVGFAARVDVGER